MKYVFPKSLVVFLMVMVSSIGTVRADHLAAADLSYTCLGNQTYAVELRIYRDCSGIPASPGASLFVEAPLCRPFRQPIRVHTLLDTSYTVPEPCRNSPFITTCAGGNLPGIELNIYKGIIRLPEACPDWVLSYKGQNRPLGLTNVLNPGNTDLYVEAGINSTVCVNSPTFANEATPYYCSGSCYEYQQGATAPSNTFLTYQMDCPREDGNLCLQYRAGFSNTTPISVQQGTNFDLNTSTGELSFCLPNLAQQAVFGIRVNQYDTSGQLVGYVLRQMLITSLNFGNCDRPIQEISTTVLSGGEYDSLERTFSVCPNTPLVFASVLYDPDGDSIQFSGPQTNLDSVFGPSGWNIFINQNPPFRPDSLQVLVQINALPPNFASGLFSFGWNSGACLFAARFFTEYRILTPSISFQQPLDTICPSVEQQLLIRSAPPGVIINNGRYQWQQIAGVPSTIDNDTAAAITLTIPNTTVDGDSILLGLTYTLGAGCAITDTLRFEVRSGPIDIELAANKDYLCPGDVEFLNFANSFSGPYLGDAVPLWQWRSSRPAQDTFIPSNTRLNPSLFLTGQAGDSVTLTVQATYGTCRGQDSIRLYWRDAQLLASASLDTVCSGDTIQLNAVLNNALIRPPNVDCQSYSVTAIPFAPIAGAGTPIGFNDPDNEISAPLPIGFEFDFYCAKYSVFRASTNGFVSFNPAATQGCCGSKVIPTRTAAFTNNIIALVWDDLDVSTGRVEYFTTGTAPNRILVVNYIDVDHVNGRGTLVTVQLQLYERDNSIEIHTTTQPNGVLRQTQGIQDGSALRGITPPGRNFTFWTATNDAYRFSIDTISFTPIVYRWFGAVAEPDSANTISALGITSNYIITATEERCAYRDTLEVVVAPPVGTPQLRCLPTSDPVNTLGFTWSGDTLAAAWEYSLDRGATWVARPLADSSLLLSGLGPDSCGTLWVRALPTGRACSNGAIDSLTCCTAACTALNATLDSMLLEVPTCGNNNGQLGLSVGGLTPVTYQWSDGQTGPVATNLAPNVGYSITVDYLGCLAILGPFVLPSDSLQLSVVALDTINCAGDSTAFIQLAANANTTYQWSNGATSSSLSNFPAGRYTVTATLGNCQEIRTWVVSELLVATGAWIQQPGQRSVVLAWDSTAVIQAPVLQGGQAYNGVWQVVPSDLAILADATANRGSVTATEGGQGFLYWEGMLDGCTISDTLNLTVDRNLALPDAFTPNGDGINDVYRPLGLSAARGEVVTFRIFNRWGQLIYDDPEAAAWDGTFMGVPQPTEVYIYVLEYRVAGAEMQRVRGAFTLLR